MPTVLGPAANGKRFYLGGRRVHAVLPGPCRVGGARERGGRRAPRARHSVRSSIFLAVKERITFLSAVQRVVVPGPSVGRVGRALGHPLDVEISCLLAG